jgi:cation diffusion facilitator family transporter
MVDAFPSVQKTHIFLGKGHEQNERRTWMVIALCSFMMIAEIIGGLLFGSIALVADGLHMSTHASALLLAALAYRYARRYAEDARFSFGTGKLGDLAGFSSAIILALISLVIGYEAITRFIRPVPISFNEAIPIAVLGLAVNIASVLLLSGGGHHHHHYGHSNADPDHDHDEAHRLESKDEIPEPHDFLAHVSIDHGTYSVNFVEHEHAHSTAHRDNNMRAAIIHVLADATVSMLVIVGLLFGRFLGWTWMDPVAGLCGAVVIAAWSYGLVRDTGAVLLDMNPDQAMAERMRTLIETDGDRLTDFHVWRLGPGHLGAILSVATNRQRGSEYYQTLLSRFRSLSHVTIEVQQS